MFVSEEAAGIGENTRNQEITTGIQSGEMLLAELRNVSIVSHTGLSERRNLIKSWTVIGLVCAYTALRLKVIMKGNISSSDRILLEAMNKEGSEQGGKHTNKIIRTHPENIPHGQGLTLTNPQGIISAGYTQLYVWHTLQDS